MRKILRGAMDVLIVLLLLFWSVGAVAESEQNKVIESIGEKLFGFTILLAIIWIILVVVLDVRDRFKYEKDKIWSTIVCTGIIMLFSIRNEDNMIDGLKRGGIIIGIICVFNYIFRESRRERVKINSNYNLRACKREDADFIYELKKEGFEWYIKDLTGWDEKEQKEIIKKEMDAHLEDMNIIRYDFEDVGVFTYYEDENNDIFIDLIALKETARGRGIGSNLLHYLIVNNPNKRLYLKTYNENPARQLYIRNGFVKYDETDTHWLMERKLEMEN